MYRSLLSLLLLLPIFIMAQETKSPAVTHPKIGTTASNGTFSITLTATIQNLQPNSRDKDIMSPKSANISPNRTTFFINSLEGCRTPVYSMHDLSKLYTLTYNFTVSDSTLWHDDGLEFDFTKQYSKPNVFSGKPVEGTFSHNGKYFWVPFYRRSYDSNAIEPSAMAIVDTEQQKIIRVMNTSVLPKMVKCSHDGNTIAVTHWGDNTVCLIDCSSSDPTQWKYTDTYIIDYRFVPQVKVGQKVNRDIGSGYALRGTVFTPDDRYLLIGCMGRNGGIAVIDLKEKKYLGRMMGMMSNVRHLVISHGYLYLSINDKGYVQRLDMYEVIKAIKTFNEETKIVKVDCWRNAKVGAGARTICLSPDGKYVFAACNFQSCISVVDTRTMKEILTIPADSYPVGMDISKDGKTLIVTSQGRNNQGGNSVDIYSITY